MQPSSVDITTLTSPKAIAGGPSLNTDLNDPDSRLGNYGTTSPKLGTTLGESKPRRRLLKRSHHTVCTIRGKSEKLRNGYKMDYYIHYVFGGLIQEADGRFCPTNDLIEVVTKNVVLDKTQTDVENPIKPSMTLT